MAQAKTVNTKNSISIKYLLPPAIIIPLFFINLFFISGLVYILYQNTYSCVYEEKLSLLKTTKNLIFNDSSPQLKAVAVDQLAASPYVMFARLVDSETNNIIASAGPEPGLLPGEKFPDFKDQPSIAHRVRSGSSIVEMSVGNGREGLWLGFEINTIQMHFVEAVGFSIILIILADMLFYFLAYYFFKKLFLSPFNQILAIIDRLGKGDFDVKVSVKTNILSEIEQLSDSLDKMKEGFKNNQKRSEMISRLKSEFISIAAHQLRTPLSAIKWALDMLARGDLGQVNQEQKELLEKSDESNNRMILLVNDLLNVSRIEEGRFGFKFAAGDLGQALRKSIADTSLVAQKLGVKVIFNEPAPKPRSVMLDSEKLKIALDNLLSNAIKYSKPGGQVQVSLSPHKSNYLEVTIKDDGIGIPKSDLKKLFNKFFRAENAVKKQTEGSGLGLFIAKNIILNHGGKIWAESKENSGSKFHFTIPTEAKLVPEQELKFEDFFQSL